MPFFEKKIKIEQEILKEKKLGLSASSNSALQGSIKKESVNKKEWFTQEGQLVVDVYQTEENLVIQTVIAGVKAEDLDISIENDMVIIKGKRERPEETGERNYFCQECYWGPFSRKIILSEEVDPSRVEATMRNGILTLKFPKIQRDKKRKIEIR